MIWNNTLGELWRRTTIYLRRALARNAGMTQEQLNLKVLPAYAKVTEYQKRGLIHVHVLVRLDRAMPKYREHEIHPPPARYDAELLEHAFRDAVADVFAPIAPELGAGRIRWGAELDEAPRIAAEDAIQAARGTRCAIGVPSPPGSKRGASGS